MTRRPILCTAPAGRLLGIAEERIFSRREESLAAGILAQKALETAGSGEPFGRGPDGLPLWPRGYSGSISHCRGEAAAAVRQGPPLGIDMEKIWRVTDKIFEHITIPRERISALSFPDKALFRALIFSGKEAAWKLLQNLAGVSPGWQDITVIPLEGGRLTARGCDIDMHGVYLLHKDMVIVIMEKKDEGTFPDPSWITQ